MQSDLYAHVRHTMFLSAVQWSGEGGRGDGGVGEYGINDHGYGA